jgi:hypothetical protein
MSATAVITRIDRSLLILERKDVAFVTAARATFINVLRVLRDLQKRVKTIKKQYKGYDEAAADVIESAFNKVLSPLMSGEDVIGWYLIGGTGSGIVKYPEGVPHNLLTICLERPHSGNTRYAGVYLDYGVKSAGGMIKIKLPGAYTPVQFADAEWFAMHAADIFDDQDSIFVHEITHYFDTMRSKDHDGYVKSNAPGRKAFWDSPEHHPAPDAYFLGNEEVNARFNEFVSSCLRLLDLSAFNTRKEYTNLIAQAHSAGKSFQQYVGGSEPLPFLQDRVRSIVGITSTPSRFIANALTDTSPHLQGFSHTLRLLQKDPARWRQMVKRLTLLYSELRKRADGYAHAIFKKKRLTLSVKRARSTVHVRDSAGKQVKTSWVKYVHRT